MKRRHRQVNSRFKRTKRAERLASGRVWLKGYKGKHAVKSYRARYGTDRVTAAIELKLLGYPISEERITEMKQEVATVAAAKKVAREAELQGNQDDTFAYIAGYTCSGVPYGVTWEEMAEEGSASALKRNNREEAGNESKIMRLE